MPSSDPLQHAPSELAAPLTGPQRRWYTAVAGVAAQSSAFVLQAIRLRLALPGADELRVSVAVGRPYRAHHEKWVRLIASQFNLPIRACYALTEDHTCAGTYFQRVMTGFHMDSEGLRGLQVFAAQGKI